MTTNALRTAFGLSVALAAIVIGQPVGAVASGLTFTNTPADRLVNTVDHRYGSNIILGSGINRSRLLTVDVPNQADFDGRLSLVNYLAHALDADYRRVVTVRFVALGHVPPPQVDNDGTVGFASQRMPVRTAIRVIASAQGARVTMPNLRGTVHFSNRQLSVREAARELTQQTGTAWVLSYILVPRTPELASAGRTIGYTAAGRPITVGAVAAPAQQVNPVNRYMHRSNVTSTATQDTSDYNQQTSAATGTPSWYPYVVWPVSPPPPPYVTTLNPIAVLGVGPAYGGPTVTTPNGGVTVLPYYGGPTYYIGPNVSSP